MICPADDPRPSRPSTLDPVLDGPRIATQFAAVERLLIGGDWWTLARICEVLRSEGIAASEAGISARIRELDDPRAGGRRHEKRRIGPGLWEYRLAPAVNLPLWRAS